MNNIKLNLGCGDEYLEGYVNCDMYASKVDMRFDASKINFGNNEVDEIRAYHLIEHFDFKQVFDVLKEWCRALKPGGILRVETPDFLNSCKSFVEGNEQVRLNLYGHFFAQPWLDGFVHKFLFTEAQLRWSLEQCGFKDIQRMCPDSSYAKSNFLNPNIYLNIKAIKA